MILGGGRAGVTTHTSDISRKTCPTSLFAAQQWLLSRMPLLCTPTRRHCLPPTASVLHIADTVAPDGTILTEGRSTTCRWTWPGLLGSHHAQCLILGTEVCFRWKLLPELRAKEPSTSGIFWHKSKKILNPFVFKLHVPEALLIRAQNGSKDVRNGEKYRKRHLSLYLVICAERNDVFFPLWHTMTQMSIRVGSCGPCRVQLTFFVNYLMIYTYTSSILCFGWSLFDPSRHVISGGIS